MSNQAEPAGGLNHLIEQLRLSDNARAHAQHGSAQPQSSQRPPSGPALHRPTQQQNSWHHHNEQQPQHQSGFAPRGGRQQQYRGNPSMQHHIRQPQHPQHRQTPAEAQRGVSLMDYVKSPGNRSAQNQVASPIPVASQHPHTPRGGQFRQHGRNFSQERQVYNPVAQVEYLERLAQVEIPKAAIDSTEIRDKQAFRAQLEATCQEVLQRIYPQPGVRLSFIPYGSMLSGFAVAGSDMDIICSIQPTIPDLEADVLTRSFEGALLSVGVGARALTRTRVPILKICQKPGEQLHRALLDEHEKWLLDKDKPEDNEVSGTVATETAGVAGANDHANPSRNDEKEHSESKQQDESQAKNADGSVGAKDKAESKAKHWRREKTMGPLDFPKNGVGFQCDISFRGLLGVHNTQLLRCYSACDPRVRDMVLFIKSWAKRRKINNSYSGTLCSYGWVLLVLHYLINVARPPVLPNLQLEFGAYERQHIVDGYNVAFADDEQQLHQLAQQGRLTRNAEPLGSLLRGFFHYYAHQGPRVAGGGFRWRDDVVSLRHRGGLVSKASKGWTGAVNAMVHNVEVRQRYLLAVECPLEVDHNVARTVHHYGVVAIRDELRRAWSILEAVRCGATLPGELFDEVEDAPTEEPATAERGQGPQDQAAGTAGS